ncbi:MULTISPECIES: hypothetical protein [Haloferacaceae]|uniref:Uncharacterized protein n=1 Tax=Halorubrum glutamatedens TaxID=2707018 RepID=A0ABD5QTQ2_9EURY|nr:hypothetical protein [Halobellus captivus]
MPATSQHNEQAATTPNPFPGPAAEYGENPARFLANERVVDDGDGTRGELMLARIRGLETIELCGFWLAVERALANKEGREPRDRVERAIRERKAHLEEHGEGLPQAGMTSAERREAAADRDSESAAVLLDEDGEEVSWSRQRGASVGASR